MLCSHDDCTGCFACEGICSKGAISHTVDEEGFHHPIINNDICVRCHACEQVCPALHPIQKNAKGMVYAAWSLDDSIRTTSSSGGLYSEFALAIISGGGIAVGASMDGNGYVHHTIVSSKEQLAQHRGSKYVQSIINGDIYKTIRTYLKSGQNVLFSGCPCQIAAVRSYFKDAATLYTIDLVCHGVPSPMAFAKLYDNLKHQYPNLVSYNFRKLDAWGVCNSCNINININNTIINIPLAGNLTYYQDAFLKGYLHRPNCYNCHYTSIERVGDLTIADFWGIGTHKPISNKHKKGCSMLSVNSTKGKKLFELIKSRIYYEHRDIQETIDGGNEQIVAPPTRPVERNNFYHDLYRMPIEEVIHKYHLELTPPPPAIYKIIISKLLRLLRLLPIR